MYKTQDSFFELLKSNIGDTSDNRLLAPCN